MKPSEKQHPATLLKGSAGVGLALAAGAALPAKADAAIIVNNDPISISSTREWMRINFDPNPGAINVQTTAGSSGSGWLFLETGSSLFLDPNSFFNTYVSVYHDFLALSSAAPTTFSAPPPSIDLAALPSGYNWTSNGGSSALPSVGNEFYVGLRYRELMSGESYFGWAQFEVGSIDHLQTVFNTEDGGSLTLGQGAIPEPSRALLLTMGMAGITAFRRNRKRTSPAKRAAVA